MKRFEHDVRLGLAAVMALTAGMTLMGGCTTKARIPVTGLQVPVPNIPLPALLRVENDLRSRSWTRAFDILHARLSREYAYTDHKDVDWDKMYAVTAPEVAAAEEKKDPDAWYLALRRYLSSIPDGNVQFDPNDVLRDQAEGASAGLALARLADGTIIACGIVPDGPAAQAGIQQGASILRWGGKPLAEALAETDLLWADAPAATPEGRLLQQLVWLPRGHNGEICEVVYTNPGAAGESTASLTLDFDGYATLALARPLWKPVELFASPIEARVLPGELHYVRVAAMAPTFTTPFPHRDFRTAIKSAIDKGARGLILDVRGTQGGDANMPAKLLGSFVKTPEFFETPAVWDSELETFLVESEDTVEIAPQLPAWEGPVVLLVDAYTMGPAESMAHFLQQRDNVTVVGEAPTYGAPGTPNVDLTLPGGYMVYFPNTRSLDREGKIRGAANEKGKGVITPDTLVPMDATAQTRVFNERKDIVLEAAQALLKP